MQINFFKKYTIKPFEVLLALYIFGIIVVNLAGAKTMPLGSWGSWRFDITVAIFLMPLLYTIIDCVSEVYGRQRAKSIVFMGLVCIVLLMGFIALAVVLPTAPKFMADKAAYERIFGVSLRMALASFTGFFVSEFMDVLIYAQLRKKTKGKMIWLRNNVSNIVGELIDTIIFMTVAFYGMDMGGTTVDFLWLIPRIIPLWLVKCLMSVISTPLCYAGIKYLKKYEDKQKAVESENNGN